MLKQIKVTKYTSGEISVHLSWIRQILPRHREAITKKEGKKPDKNRIIYSWEAVYFQCDRMFRDRPTVETGEIHQFFFWIRRRWNPCRGNVLFFFLPHRNPVWSGKYLKSFFHRDIAFFREFSFTCIIIRFYPCSSFFDLHSCTYSFTIADNVWEGKGFRKSYIASETSINMTNGRNLFTNYFFRVVQYLFQSV